MTTKYQPTFGTSLAGFGQDPMSVPQEISLEDASAMSVGSEEGVETGGEVATNAGAAPTTPVSGTVQKDSVPRAQYNAALAEAKKWKRNFWIAFGVGLATTTGGLVGGYYLGRRSARKGFAGWDDGMGDVGDTGDLGVMDYQPFAGTKRKK